MLCLHHNKVEHQVIKMDMQQQVEPHHLESWVLGHRVSDLEDTQTSDLDNVLNLDGEKYHGGLVFELITTDPATESRDDYFEILSCFHHHLSERKCLPSIRKTAALNCTVQLCTIPTSSEWVIDRFNFLQISEREICF